jgi:hypothetical protein
MRDHPLSLNIPGSVRIPNANSSGNNFKFDCLARSFLKAVTHRNRTAFPFQFLDQSIDMREDTQPWPVALSFVTKSVTPDYCSDILDPRRSYWEVV